MFAQTHDCAHTTVVLDEGCPGLGHSHINKFTSWQMRSAWGGGLFVDPCGKVSELSNGREREPFSMEISSFCPRNCWINRESITGTGCGPGASAGKATAKQPVWRHLNIRPGWHTDIKQDIHIQVQVVILTNFNVTSLQGWGTVTKLFTYLACLLLPQHHFDRLALILTNWFLKTCRLKKPNRNCQTSVGRRGADIRGYAATFLSAFSSISRKLQRLSGLASSCALIYRYSHA